ncbi:MAG TPA: polysaccharide pyruvyl transferase family protein [Rhodoferax sp.]|nr:polysaccharide pyruvyl transferase family protein [Rhodoferax sp.]
MSLIHYCSIAGGNFGDDINLQLWSRLFPDLSELTDQVLFYGVGTLLDGRHDARVKKVVLGTGLGSHLAGIPDSNWDFRWVRGPQTAKEFGLPRELALGDSAILWPELLPGHDDAGPAGLIPHHATWDSFDWASVAHQAGMKIINPRQPPGAVIDQMRGCSRVLSESLHGAICADAMGIPWAACVLAHRFNEFKWQDWLATVNRPHEPLVMQLPLVRSITRTKSMANRLARWIKYKRRTRRPALRPVAAATARDVERVAAALRAYAGCAGNFRCSDPVHVAQQKERMLSRCDEFARDYKLLFTP